MAQIKPKSETRRGAKTRRRSRVAHCLELEEHLSELAAQQAAISEVLLSIANSPHELEPIFDTITANATRLCRAKVGALILFEEHGYRVVARTGAEDAYYVKGQLYPIVEGAPSARMIKTRSPVHIADLTKDQAYLQRIPGLVALVERIGIRSYLLVPMLKEKELVGGIAIVRAHVQPFTDKQVELVTAFAAQATIALEITRRERQLRQVQMELAHATRVATMGQLTASIAHEVKQPIAATVVGATAARRFLGAKPADLYEARLALDEIEKAGKRAGDVINRIHGLIKKELPRKDRLEINGAIREVLELTRGEAVRNGVSVQAEFADELPLVEGDRVELQQVMLNLIINAIEALSGTSERSRELLISTGKTESGGVLVAVRDSGPGLSPTILDHVFDAFYTTKPSGMGMGLSICRSIIVAHGGRLWASANVPDGATFQFTLPGLPDTASQRVA
jgi:C4-dicarboxylate-specific signal transduction histidine kinase